MIRGLSACLSPAKNVFSKGEDRFGDLGLCLLDRFFGHTISAELSRQSGSTSTPAKARAACKNGGKGGRPKKTAAYASRRLCRFRKHVCCIFFRLTKSRVV